MAKIIVKAAFNHHLLEQIKNRLIGATIKRQIKDL